MHMLIRPSAELAVTPYFL